MVKFYGKVEYDDKNNICYGEKLALLNNLEEKLERDMSIYDDKYRDIYNDMHDQFISPNRTPKFDMNKWIEINRKRKLIICNYIIDRSHILIKSGEISIPFICKNEYDIHEWFRNNRRYLYLFHKEYHIRGIDYSCLFTHNIPNDGTLDEHIYIEIERLSSNFMKHKHDVDVVDMIICHKKDIDIFYDNPKGEKVPILELSYKLEK